MTTVPKPTPDSPPRPSLLVVALAHAAAKRPVFPCSPKTKRPLISSREGGKGFHDATTDENTIRTWWERYPYAVPGMPTGEKIGIWVLDVDNKEGRSGDDTMALLERTFGSLPDTVETITATGGRHLFFRHPRNGLTIPDKAAQLGVGTETWGHGGYPEVPFRRLASGRLSTPGVDVRGDGGYVILPGSVMADGRVYHWEGSSDPNDGVRVATAPDWLLALVCHDPKAAQPASRADGSTKAGAPIVEGARNDWLFRLGCSLRAKGCGQAAIVAALLAENGERCQPPLPVDEVRATALSTAKYAAGDPGPKATAKSAASSSPAAAKSNVSPIRCGIDLPGPADDTPAATPETAVAHFQVLGHDGGSFYFFPARAKQVVRLRPADMGRVAPFLQLAPLKWWEQEFPSAHGFKGDALSQAANRLVNSSYAAGVFSYDALRGRGAWHDQGRIVIHVGDRLLVDGAEVAIGSFADTQYVYEARRALRVDLSDPLPDSESMKLLDLCRLLSWEKSLYPVLAAGWITSALICGCMHWRSHIIITGPSYCGKSWVVKLFQKLLGMFMISGTGESSEAGFRQKMQHDSLPVTWDEAEGEDQRTTANLDRVLALIRQASDDNSGVIYKGGEGGVAHGFTVRTAVCLAAIRVPMKAAADKSRITVLGLHRNAEEDIERFKTRILPLAAELCDDAWTMRFRARILMHAGTLRRNALTFAAAVSERLGDARTGDQLGPMLAGAAFLASTKTVPKATADAWVRGLDLGDQAELLDTRDEDHLLAAILEAHIRVPVERSHTEASVGELIAICDGRGHNAIIDRTAAAETLARHGIRYLMDHVAISNTHRSVSVILRATSWGVGWAQVLRRVEGATASPGVMYFGGARSRAVLIPIIYFRAAE